jgi:hypothetical protein
MAHKTFISYKYSESRNLRDEIIKALGDDATYYQGETSDSPDLTDTSTDNIKKHLKDMIYGTSVTIVIISPNIKESKWIDWEIEYSLKEITRNDKTSRTSGIVGVVMKQNDNYTWLRTSTNNSDGHVSISTNNSLLYDIISKNRGNQVSKEYFCDKCGTIDALTGSFISLVTEEEFLSNPTKYIDNAFDKAKNIDNYEIRKIR